MKKPALVFFVLLVFSQVAEAARPLLYFKNSGDIFSFDVVSDGQTEVAPGLRGYDLRKMVEGDPVAVAFVEDQRRLAGYALITDVGSVAFLVTGIILGSTYRNSDYSSSRLAWALGADLVALGGLFWTVSLMQQSRSALLKAVNHYNGVDVGAKANPDVSRLGEAGVLTFALIPGPDAIALGAGLKF